MLHIWRNDGFFKDYKPIRQRKYKKREWNDERIAYVKENYYKMTRQELADALNTTVYDIANIVFKIRQNGGLEKRKSRKLTEEEIFFIEENRDSMSASEIARRLGRRPSVVSRYLRVR